MKGKSGWGSSVWAPGGAAFHSRAKSVDQFSVKIEREARLAAATRAFCRSLDLADGKLWTALVVAHHFLLGHTFLDVGGSCDLQMIHS
jgi:hypothetical protein